jgi:hypothetical protein
MRLRRHHNVATDGQCVHRRHLRNYCARGESARLGWMRVEWIDGGLSTLYLHSVTQWVLIEGATYQHYAPVEVPGRVCGVAY